MRPAAIDSAGGEKCTLADKSENTSLHRGQVDEAAEEATDSACVSSEVFALTAAGASFQVSGRSGAVTGRDLVLAMLSEDEGEFFDDGNYGEKVQSVLWRSLAKMDTVCGPVSRQMCKEFVGRPGDVSKGATRTSCCSAGDLGNK
jgi:hypothetical protein